MIQQSKQLIGSNHFYSKGCWRR